MSKWTIINSRNKTMYMGTIFAEDFVIGQVFETSFIEIVMVVRVDKIGKNVYVRPW